MLLASHAAAALLTVPCVPVPIPATAARVPAATRQLVTVEASSAQATHASLRIWRRARSNGCWRSAGGPWPARVGHNGLSSDRREGDGTTPAGSFAIGPTMYGVAPNPGVRYRYRRLVCGDWWSEDPSSPTYNTFRHLRCGARPPFATTTAGLWQQPTAYVHFAVIEYNTRPIVRGRGSGIFLHAQTGRPTNGCVSLVRATLVRVLRWLDPAAAPRIVIGTSASLHR